jgi:hypothetical protein
MRLISWTLQSGSEQLKTSFYDTFLCHICFAVNAVNYDPYGIWTSLKMVLTPLKC